MTTHGIFTCISYQISWLVKFVLERTKRFFSTDSNRLYYRYKIDFLSKNCTIFNHDRKKNKSLFFLSGFSFENITIIWKACMIFFFFWCWNFLKMWEEVLSVFSCLKLVVVFCSAWELVVISAHLMQTL